MSGHQTGRDKEHIFGGAVRNDVHRGLGVGKTRGGAFDTTMLKLMLSSSAVETGPAAARPSAVASKAVLRLCGYIFPLYVQIKWRTLPDRGRKVLQTGYAPDVTAE
jgi:hypothetical protein